MPVVLLKKDGVPVISQCFSLGEHILGRGKLQCSSKKVSRNHGLLKVTENEGITLKSTHNNPCFYKMQQSKNVSLLTFGNSVQINNNDRIALSLDHGWFIVQIKDNNEENNTVTVNEPNLNDTNNTTVLSQTLKRAIGEIDNSAAKKPKIDDNEIIPPEEIKTEPPDQPSTSTNNLPEKEVNVELKSLEINFGEVKQEPVTQEEFQTQTSDIKVEEHDVKSETKNEENEENGGKSKCSGDNDDQPSTSGTNKRPWRDRCWYGVGCYRKNGAHRLELSHPGDADYASDPEDSRPICCYGAGCYRRNREHRKRYRHPGQTKLGTKPAPNPQGPQPLPKRRTVKPPNYQQFQDSDDLDDYDYSDPFLDDGSEDEFEPSQLTDTESEYEDSQEADEDSKRLLKDAKKFIHGKK